MRVNKQKGHRKVKLMSHAQTTETRAPLAIGLGEQVLEKGTMEKAFTVAEWGVRFIIIGGLALVCLALIGVAGLMDNFEGE